MSDNTFSPSLSVIIPTYNYANYIGAAIDSILAQPEACQIIVVDDGSTDNTREVVSAYGNSVIYIYQDNKGVSAARNHGVSMASGEYIVFLDADDRLLPNSLDIITKKINHYPDVDFFIAGHTSVNYNSKKKTYIPEPLSTSNIENFTNFLRKKLGSVTIAAIKRSIFNTIKFPESIRNNEDIVFVAQLLAMYTCCSIPESVIEVHKHADSLRHNLSSALSSTYRVADILFDENILPEEFMRMKNEFSSRVLLSRFRSLYLAGNCKDARKLYHNAISLYPKNIFLLAYLKKYIKCYLSYSN